MVPEGPKQFGVKVCCSPDGEEQTLVYYDATDKKLKVDTRKSGREGPKKIEAGPFELKPGETLKLRELDYVKAARALGVSDFRIVVRHILPNLMHLVIITFALMFSGLVLAEAVLSWLGIGLEGSWGQMIDQSRDELSREPVVWWNLVAAATALFVLILAVNRIGDAVRDVLDPRTARETP
jgi:ABC-type dipeptide/oligopeptide/nickel transport system permease subunit